MLSLSAHPRRLGLTLVELLVVLGILALLVALLLPAILRTREAARRTVCQSNLHNIGLALNFYESNHKALPPGYSPRVMRDLEIADNEPGYAWSVMLLPYLEQKALYDALRVGTDTLRDVATDPLRKPLLDQQLDIYKCHLDQGGPTMESAPIPADRKRLVRGRNGDPDSAFGGTSSYVGSCGFFEEYHPCVLTPGAEAPRKNGQLTGPNNGLFYNASAVPFRDIPDGLSNTIAIGERAWFQGSSTWVGTANLPGLAHGAGVCLARVYWRINRYPDPPGILIKPGDPDTIARESTGRAAFGSYHPGGANFLLADGKVVFLSENIDFRNPVESEAFDVPKGIPDIELLGVFQKLGVRNDGQPVGTY